jgi:hypothetical protein
LVGLEELELVAGYSVELNAVLAVLGLEDLDAKLQGLIFLLRIRSVT